MARIKNFKCIYSKITAQQYKAYIITYNIYNYNIYNKE